MSLICIPLPPVPIRDPHEDDGPLETMKRIAKALELIAYRLDGIDSRLDAISHSPVMWGANDCGEEWAEEG